MHEAKGTQGLHLPDKAKVMSREQRQDRGAEHKALLLLEKVNLVRRTCLTNPQRRQLQLR